MRNKFSYVSLSLLVFLFALLLFYGNLQFAKAEPGGSDFLYRWLPTRLVLIDGYESPYSSAVEYQVELARFGHVHQGNESSELFSYPYFSYPYYTMAIISPFALISDYTTARATWMTVLELAHIIIVFLTLKMTDFKPTYALMTALILFALLNADFSQALIDGNPSSLAALFAVLSLYYISRKSDGLAGVFLALSTIKPQLVILFFALICFWALSQRRWVIIYSSVTTMIILLGLSFLLQPSWFIEFIGDLAAYPGIADPSTPRTILAYWMPAPFAKNIALGLTILSIFIIFRVWKNCLNKDFLELLWVACITFTIMPFIGITSAKSNYITMLPGVILLIKYGLNNVKKREGLLSMFLLVWIGLSWLFFYAGRNWVLGGNLIYFVDFYPMPIVLLTLYFLFKKIPLPSIIKVQNS